MLKVLPTSVYIEICRLLTGPLNFVKHTTFMLAASFAVNDATDYSSRFSRPLAFIHVQDGVMGSLKVGIP